VGWKESGGAAGSRGGAGRDGERGWRGAAGRAGSRRGIVGERCSLRTARRNKQRTVRYNIESRVVRTRLV
jgi:hypothetical protein